MKPVFAARRRAAEFDALVETTPTSGSTDARYAEFLEIVASLRDLPDAQARPEFVADLRGRLMQAAEAELVPAPEARLRLPARRPPRDRRLAAAVGGFAVVGATTSMAMAAQSALPGEALYPLKRAIENAQAGLSVDERRKGVTLLQNASDRLAEISALSEAGQLEDGSMIAQTFTAFTGQAVQASDLLLNDYAESGQESSITELRDFTADSMQTLADLEALVPADARDELLHAARVLTQIDLAAAQACPSCAGEGIAEIPAILTSAGFTPGTATVVTPTDQIRRSGDRKDASDEEGGVPQLPDTDGSLPPGSVLNAPTGSGTSTGSGSGSGDGVKSDLTDGLKTGGGTTTDEPTSTGSRLPGVSDVEKTVEDTTGSLLGTD